MQGVVSILDEPHFGLVTQLWAELKHHFGIGRVKETAVPHFSYHVAPSYDLEKLKAILLETAVCTPSFTVKTSGIGIFPGETPVVYLPIVRDAALMTLHTGLWPQLQAISKESLAYYAPLNWVPHITLCQTDITPGKLGAVVTWLNNQQLTWKLEIRTLSLMRDSGRRHKALHTFSLDQ